MMMMIKSCLSGLPTAAVLVSQAEAIVRSLTNMAAADSNGYLKSNDMLNINYNRRNKHYTYSYIPCANFYKNRASLFKQSHNAAMFVGEASRRLQRLLPLWLLLFYLDLSSKYLIILWTALTIVKYFTVIFVRYMVRYSFDGCYCFFIFNIKR